MEAGQLVKIPLFTTLTLDQCESVAGVCSELAFETGSTLLQEGDFGYSMFAITNGTADVIKDGQVVRSLGAGDVFGEIAVLSGGRRTATVLATSPIELVTILNRDVWRMERDHPEIASALRTQISDEVGSAAQWQSLTASKRPGRTLGPCGGYAPSYRWQRCCSRRTALPPRPHPVRRAPSSPQAGSTRSR